MFDQSWRQCIVWTSTACCGVRRGGGRKGVIVFGNRWWGEGGGLTPPHHCPLTNINIPLPRPLYLSCQTDVDK